MPRPPSSTAYSFGFLAASLRPELLGVIAEHFERYRSWDRARAAILESNALQCSSPASSARLERELRPRLETLTTAQLDLLNRATFEGRVALAWLATVKRHAFLFEFAAETLRAKLEQHDPLLRSSDYACFVEEKALTHLELEALTDSSLGKVRRVLLRMLRETGILTKGPELGALQRPVVPPEVEDAIRADDPLWLAAFLVPDSQI